MLFLIRQFRHDHPLVNLKVFRNRNFAIGCVLIGIFGAAIYGLVTLLPLLYQELLGYNALAAGVAVSPRGVGAIVAMPVIGLLTARIDNRWLIAVGFALFGISSLWFGRVNLANLPVVISVGDHHQRIRIRLHLRSAVDHHDGRSSE